MRPRALPLLALALVVFAPGAQAGDGKPPPVITSIEPPRGTTAGGTSVWLTGDGFTPDMVVRVGGVSAKFLRADASHAVVTTPATSTSGMVDVTVTTGAGTARRSSGFAYRLDGTYSTAAPTVTAVQPAAGSESNPTSVMIIGTGFTAGMSVFVGPQRASCASAYGPTTLACTFPAQSAGHARVAVTSADGRTGLLPSPFTYVARPKITRVTAGSLAVERVFTTGGATITISGAFFQNGATVLVGTAKATNVVVANAQTITAVTPPAPAGPADVTVRNPDGQTAVLQGALTVQAPPVVVLLRG